jgi:hypothetical protein
VLTASKAWHDAGAREETNHDLEGVDSKPHGRAGGTDFFAVEVLTWRGLVTYYVMLFLHLETFVGNA